MAYLSRPKAAGKYPGLLIIHENRGLTPHIEDVARRFANQGYVALAAKYSNDPQAQFMAGWHAFALKQPDKYAGYFEKAYSLKPDNVEFRLFAGLAALSSKNYDKVISIMEGIKSENLYPAEELFRLTALQKAWKDRDQAKSDQYGQQITAILEKYQAQAAYKNRILPLLNAFGPQ